MFLFVPADLKRFVRYFGDISTTCTGPVRTKFCLVHKRLAANVYTFAAFAVVRPDRDRKTEPGTLWAGESGQQVLSEFMSLVTCDYPVWSTY